MDAQPSLAPSRWGRALGITFGLTMQLVFAITVWGLFWYLYGGGAGQGGSAHWLAINSLLALQFAVPHSVLLLPSVRSRLSRWMPSALVGTLFCAVTCASLWLIFTYWRTTPAAVWWFDGLPALAMRAAFVASWIMLFYSLSLSGFGYQTGWTQWRYWLRRQPLPPRGLVARGAYRWLRHPAYLSFLGLIWFTPQMTLDHAVLTGIWTAYIFYGSALKDRRLEFYLRDEYRQYASGVPGYPGMPFGPLARWAAPAPSPKPMTLPRAA